MHASLLAFLPVVFFHYFNLALFLQDLGFNPPYGSDHLPIVNFLYAYIETSTLKEILRDTADINVRSLKNTTHSEDQHGLVKLSQVTLY